MTTFTVAICTRNRAHLLPRTITAVLDQDYPREAYEVLVVDNGSTDDTSRVAASFAANSPVEFRFVVQKSVGISAARNRAAREARNDYVAFVDDDAIPARNWLSALHDVIEEHGALVVGGR